MTSIQISNTDFSSLPVDIPSDTSGLHVHKIFKKYNKRAIVRDVSMYLKRGEIVGLLGPNGAGKTTTFSMIAGLVSPDAGEITLDGRSMTHMAMYQRARLGVGYLPQEASIFRGLTVEDNIRCVLEITVERKSQREDILDNLLSEFSIAHLRQVSALSLSGGERRRVEIARALAGYPSFMLLDEPLAGIDPITINDIRNLIYHLKDRGIGVLITDHNVRETLDIVDRAYIINEGHVLMHGTPAAIIADENVRRVYLGESFKL